MALAKPDPRFTHSKRAQRSFRLALKISLVFIGIIWAIFSLDAVFGLRLGRGDERDQRGSFGCGAEQRFARHRG